MKWLSFSQQSPQIDTTCLVKLILYAKETYTAMWTMDMMLLLIVINECNLSQPGILNRLFHRASHKGPLSSFGIKIYRNHLNCFCFCKLHL